MEIKEDNVREWKGGENATRVEFRHFLFDFTELEILKMFGALDAILNGVKPIGIDEIKHIDVLEELLGTIRRSSDFSFDRDRLELLEQMVELQGKLKR